ncbi:uncharacterized protein LOC110233779 [Rhizophagus clarus]|uniref:Uncharacterized protein LOC110233779 n=1 Tax=Rhizophagus clarus TaxID=94130 RepID=A0A8H3M109_9GLOM|nr:uncharacterized protein LOC110233779 [Rhizophagus clarus]
MDADQTRFKDFPSSLHSASNLLQIDNQSKTYAVCPSYNTLYNIADVVAKEKFKCTHIEFPMKSKGKPSDIYDGKIWKNFSDTLGAPYFTPEAADSHLGIIINLDWFQPFELSVYSCKAIYGVICNLSREIRFKKENMLTLGLLPGSNEVKLHKINHYLSPIVDELLEFWDGIEIPAAGKNIRVALICCSNDIPAARKLCGHVSALVSCHKCYKAAGLSGNKLNFGGFDDMDNWHLIIDLMHCLFLGIAHWIIKKLWIDGNKITKHDLEKMEERAKNIKTPTDLGRILNKIATREGFSGFTADQWKTFILIYAIPLMWDLLASPDRKILGNFVRACSLLVCRIIDYNILNEAHEHLLKVAMLIEENYGLEKITQISTCVFILPIVAGIMDHYILSVIQPRATSGSLADYDNFEFSELWQFRKIFFQEVDNTVIGDEPFPGEMLTPCRIRITLPDNVYRI